jgi:hypothetical protein
MTTDDELLARLRVIADAVDGPPEHVEEHARAALSSRLIGHELITLLADSATTAGHTVRADDQRVRLLSFSTASVSLELQIDDVAGHLSLRGQVTGASGAVEVETPTDRRTATMDDDGWFVVPEIPAGTVRIRLRADDGTPVTTSWVSL